VPEGPKFAAEVVGGEAAEVLSKLVVRVVMIMFHGRFLDSAFHPFDLAVGPWVLRFEKAVIDIFGTDTEYRR
jgi:hypothetical protein